MQTTALGTLRMTPADMLINAVYTFDGNFAAGRVDIQNGTATSFAAAANHFNGVTLANSH